MASGYADYVASNFFRLIYLVPRNFRGFSKLLFMNKIENHPTNHSKSEMYRIFFMAIIVECNFFSPGDSVYAANNVKVVSVSIYNILHSTPLPSQPITGFNPFRDIKPLYNV